MSIDALFGIPDPPLRDSLRDSFAIERISTSLAMSMAVEHHYLHRPAPCSEAWGLVGTNGFVYGFIAYGTPSSAPLRSGIAGSEHSLDVIELTRLWVDDRVPKNGESYLIGNTVKQVEKPIVVSFAEIEAGHVGTVYQATNWLYTGLSAKRSDWTVEGIHKHGQTWADKYTVAEMRDTFGDRFKLADRPRKHRYVFLNARGMTRRRLLADLRYPVQPYPKKEVAA